MSIKESFFEQIENEDYTVMSKFFFYLGICMVELNAAGILSNNQVSEIDNYLKSKKGCVYKVGTTAEEISTKLASFNQAFNKAFATANKQANKCFNCRESLRDKTFSIKEIQYPGGGIDFVALCCDCLTLI